MSTENKRNQCGMLYIMTNAAECNQIAAFYRSSNGLLTFRKLYDTQGRGTGPNEVSPATPNDGIDPLASQGSLILSHDLQSLYAVNAGSNSISSFHVSANGDLALVKVIPSGGLQPNSLCMKNNILYVSNVGSYKNDFNSNITGFYTDKKGHLMEMPYSKRSLSTPNAQPSCILFNPSGKLLLVSELTTNRISVYAVNKNGTTSCPVVNNSNGFVPFGSVFTPTGIFIVAEARTNALSSYTISRSGQLNVVSGSVINGQLATCWVVTTPNGEYAYTSNNESGNISVYQVRTNGQLVYLNSIFSSFEYNNLGAPIDNGISTDGRYFYVLNGNQGSISVFGIEANGYLQPLQNIKCKEIPELGTQGLAVY